MAIEFETVDIWIGEFPSSQRLDSYFHEVIDPGDDDAPISEFSRAMFEAYYNHDFVERQFQESPQSVEKLLRDHSYSSSYIAQATAAAAELGVASGNTSVSVWGQQISNPVSVVGSDHSLR